MPAHKPFIVGRRKGASVSVWLSRSGVSPPATEAFPWRIAAVVQGPTLSARRTQASADAPRSLSRASAPVASSRACMALSTAAPSVGACPAT